MMFARRSTSLNTKNSRPLPNLHYKISLQTRLDRTDIFYFLPTIMGGQTDDNNINNDHFQEVKLHDKSKCMYTIDRCPQDKLMMQMETFGGLHASR